MTRHNTVRQDVFAWVVEYMQKCKGRPPTRREIMDGLQLSSTAVVDHHLRRLSDEGRIKLNADASSRNIEIPGSRWTIDGE